MHGKVGVKPLVDQVFIKCLCWEQVFFSFTDGGTHSALLTT